MEDNDSIAKLRNVSKLDFQSEKEIINYGRPMPELNGLLQTTGQKVTQSFVVPPKRLALWLCYEKSPFLLGLHNNWVHIFVNRTLKRSVPHQPGASLHVSDTYVRCVFIFNEK
jgi:hypothetical protein